MFSKALYPYREQLALAFHKRYRMSEFVRSSLTTLEQTSQQLISEIPRGARIGIFGTYDSAQLIHLKLRHCGHKDICFIKSSPRMKSLRYSPIIDSGAKQIAGLDVIITSSLASSAGQVTYLQEQGFAGQIIRLPDLKHLGIALLRDLATNQRISELEGSRTGMPAFIIGNGPSLSETDPRRIDNRFLTFAGNGIVKLGDFQPDYFFAIDQSAITMWKEQIEQLASRLFFPSNLKQVIDWELPRVAPDAVFFPLCYEQRGDLNITDWSTRGFESGHTVICPMLQFALLMGCSPIYILGVDISYAAENANYFSEDYHQAGVANYSESQTQIINRRMHRSIERVTSACARAGIEVFNCSPTKNLPYIEQISFDEALARHNSEQFSESACLDLSF